MVDQLALVLRSTAVGFAFVLATASAGLPRRARLALLPMLLCLMAYLVRSAPESIPSTERTPSGQPDMVAACCK